MNLNDAPSGPETKKAKVGVKTWIVSILALLVLAFIIIFSIRYWQEILSLIASKEAIGEWLAGWGIFAPLAYILMQVLQIVVFVIPGEVIQLAAGYFFGVWLGLLYALLGAALGTIICFVAARQLGQAFVNKLFGKEKTLWFEGFISTPKAQIVFFLLFLIPGIPKDMLCYVGGISQIKLVQFLIVSLVGRTPALFASVIIGDAAASGNWPLVIVISSIAVVCLVLGLVFRKQIHDYIDRFLHKNDKSQKNGNFPD